MKETIAYCRLSTKQQGASGLGLETQRAAVENYAKQTGARIAALYVEVESGRVADRPQLAMALSHAKRHKGVLVVAKLDRLSRDPDFLGRLMNAGVEFVCCDMPAANKLTIRILTAVAEQERQAISQRTKAALAAAKARGTKLGSSRPDHWKGREAARLAGAHVGAKAAAIVHAQDADEYYADLVPVIQRLRSAGKSLQEIAHELTAKGHVTRRGKAWNSMQVGRVLRRAEK
jgi:DNA invertase Pin-like site-specific DNA recombinase